MINLYERMQEILKKYPDVLFGISNIDFSDYKAEYKYALVFAVPHSERLNIEKYSEERFEALIHEARERSIKIMNDIADVLRRNQIRYYMPAPSQSSEEELVALFSYKYAAVNAGLGWIGKNDVLITEKHGPQVSLHAVLIDHDLPVGEPITESKCPSGCDLCSKACPYHALTGNPWSIDSKRRDLIDYQLCNQKRRLYLKTHNRKHACGLCMAACPFGR